MKPPEVHWGLDGTILLIRQGRIALTVLPEDVAGFAAQVQRCAAEAEARE